DVGDEAGLVLAAELLVDLAVRDGFCDGCFDLGGHEGCLGLHAVARRAGMRLGAPGPASGTGGGGASISAKLTPRRASATMSLMRRQLARAPHCSAMPQLVSSRLHSVIASGPSMASTISMRL